MYKCFVESLFLGNLRPIRIRDPKEVPGSVLHPSLKVVYRDGRTRMFFGHVGQVDELLRHTVRDFDHFFSDAPFLEMRVSVH